MSQLCVNNISMDSSTTATITSAATEIDPFDTRINLDEIPISALRHKSRNLLSVYLDPIKILPSQDGLSRDWRGIVYLSGLPNQYAQYLTSRQHATAEFLDIWQKEGNGENADSKPTLEQLQRFLAVIDRLDCLDDTNDYFIEDAKEYLKLKAKHERLKSIQTEPRLRSRLSINLEENLLTVDDLRLAEEGLPLQQYDAFVIFAEEDIDFATEMIGEMEKRNLKLCVKERDLLSGHSFEHDAIRRLLTDRCNRVIVILSPAFLLSALNEFIANLAQSLGITQRKRKLIPCLYESCEVPEIFRHMHLLNYQRSRNLYNYWDKLCTSVQRTPDERILVPRITISDADSQSKATPVVSKHLLPPSMSPSSLLPSFQSLSKQHSGSSVSLKIVTGRSNSLFASDHEFEKQPKIFPPEPRRRVSTSMLNINESVAYSSFDGAEIKSNNHIASLVHINIDGSVSTAREEDINSASSTVLPKKRKWYKKLLISPKKSFKLYKPDDSDNVPPKRKEKKTFWFRKKTTTAM